MASRVAQIEESIARYLHQLDSGAVTLTRVGGVRQAIDAAGARLLYLPPYSPDFNPIEQAFLRRRRPR